MKSPTETVEPAKEVSAEKRSDPETSTSRHKRRPRKPKEKIVSDLDKIINYIESPSTKANKESKQ